MNDNFGKRHSHRSEYADYVVEYLMNIPVHKFNMRRVYAAYDKFQETLISENEILIIEDKSKKPIVEMLLKKEDVFIKIKTGRKWTEVRCPLELIRFSD